MNNDNDIDETDTTRIPATRGRHQGAPMDETAPNPDTIPEPRAGRHATQPMTPPAPAWTPAPAYPAPMPPAGPTGGPTPAAPAPNPAPYRGAHGKPRWNPMAIAGFVCSFLVGLLGLILSIVGLKQTRERHERGHGLALAGVIISATSMVLGLLLAVAMIMSGAVTLTTTANGESHTYSAAPGHGSTHEPKTKSAKEYASVKAWLDGSEGRRTIKEYEDATKPGDDGLTLDVHAQGDTLVFDYTAPDEYAGMTDQVKSVYDDPANVKATGLVARMLDLKCDTKGGASVRFHVRTRSGTDLYDRTFTAADANTDTGSDAGSDTATSAWEARP